MPTKTTKRKTTQLDRTEKAIGLLTSKLTTLKAWETMQDALAEHRPSEPKVTEAPQFKEGDWVVVTERDWCKPWHGRLFQIEEANDRSVKAPMVAGWFDNENLRPATPEEIERAEQDRKWSAITELQEGDYAERTPSLAEALRRISIPLFDINPATNTLDWEPNKTLRWNGIEIIGGGERPDPLPEAEFLRRAKGTAARLEATRKAEEAKRPIPFGTRVKFKDGPPFGDAPIDEGYYIGKEGDRTHMVAYPHQNDPAIMCIYRCERSEFTVIIP